MGWIILGGGGHASVIADILLSDGQPVDGFTDVVPSPPLLGRIPYLGNDGVVLERDRRDIFLVNGIGSTGVPGLRKSLFEEFFDKDYAFPPVVSNRAYLSPHTSIGPGTVVFPGATVQTGVLLGKNVIINTGAIIDHGCQIGNHVHIASGATLSGNVAIEDRCHIGTGASIIQDVKIGKDVIVAAGAVVVTPVADGWTVLGVPARRKQL
ncbi:MAG: sugar acetyltransferase [Deltaproteobacteria bacterium]|nr:MAG: sugar acetyltransferase [Deltaproteobacteria bacterium]